MTTGTLSDTTNWRSEIDTGGNTVFVGYKSNKTWNGQDYPPNRPTYTTVYSYPYGSREYIRQRVVQRPPKRARVEEHNYTMSGGFTSDRQFTFTHRSGATGTSTYPGTFGGPTTAIQLWSSNDDLKLLGSLREKVGGSDFNLGVFLAEGHQALTTISDSALRISRAMRLFKQGRFDRAFHAVWGDKRLGPKRFPKSSADNWLMIVYGVVPLLKDAEAGAQFLAKLLNFPMVQTYRVRRTVPGLFVDNPGTTWGLHDLRTRVAIKATVREVNVPQLVGLTDVASVVWEKIPYSFVADWFIPIGAYLSARGLAAALTGTFVTSRYVKKEFGFPTLQGPLVSPFYSGSSIFHTSTVSFSRTVSTNLEVPLPSNKGLGKAASWQHCANAVALAVGSWSGTLATKGLHYDD